MSEESRWDPSTPGFVLAVLRTIVGLAIAIVIVGTFTYRTAFFGFLSGTLFAVVLYLIALQAGRIFQRTQQFTKTMLWLLISQVFLWAGMAVLLAVAKVNPIGFVIGVSVLPVAIVATLGWYALRKRRLPS